MHLISKADIADLKETRNQLLEIIIIKGSYYL